MKKQQKTKLNIRSDTGATMADLSGALAIIVIFIGLIGTLMYSAYKMNLTMRLSATSLNYAILILEDIDKIAYEEVNNGMEINYIKKFNIPKGFNISVEVKRYNEGTNKADLIKTITLKIYYTFDGKTEYITINRLKIKEPY